MPSYTVSEPHPTVPQHSYTRSGRGGSGNFFRAPATTPSTGITTTVTATPTAPGPFHSGRGGAGNAYAAVQRPVMSWEEQYKLQAQAELRSAGHVGRGGAGNVYGTTSDGASARSNSDASSRRSNSTSGSVKSGFLGRLSGTFRRSH